jgi:hypothetical protein
MEGTQYRWSCVVSQSHWRSDSQNLGFLKFPFILTSNFINCNIMLSKLIIPSVHFEKTIHVLINFISFHHYQDHIRNIIRAFIRHLNQRAWDHSVGRRRNFRLIILNIYLFLVNALSRLLLFFLFFRNHLIILQFCPLAIGNFPINFIIRLF